MESKSTKEKLTDILQIITDNPSACELKWSLLYSAILSGNTSVIKPYPPEFYDKDLSELRLEEIQRTAELVPEFQSLAREELSDAVVALLHWTFVENNEPTLRQVARDYHPHLKKSLIGKPPSQWPQYVFEVISSPESNAEKRFQQHKTNLGLHCAFAFHGSKLESFFSLLNFGLAQHLCKRDLYGEGAYMSTSMDVALNFSTKGSAWPKSQLFGDQFSALALCEYVPNARYLHTKDVPNSYVVLTNNELVQLRYILIFTRPPRKMDKNSRGWSSGAMLAFGVVLYLVLLALVGFFN